MNYESKSDQIYINLRSFTLFMLAFIFSVFLLLFSVCMWPGVIKSLHNLFFKIAHRFWLNIIEQQHRQGTKITMSPSEREREREKEIIYNKTRAMNINAYYNIIWFIIK